MTEIPQEASILEEPRIRYGALQKWVRLPSGIIINTDNITVINSVGVQPNIALWFTNDPKPMVFQGKDALALLTMIDSTLGHGG